MLKNKINTVLKQNYFLWKASILNFEFAMAPQYYWAILNAVFWYRSVILRVTKSIFNSCTSKSSLFVCLWKQICCWCYMLMILTPLLARKYHWHKFKLNSGHNTKSNHFVLCDDFETRVYIFKRPRGLTVTQSSCSRHHCSLKSSHSCSHCALTYYE